MSKEYWVKRDLAVKIRGEILHEMSFLERIVDTYLAMHFCNCDTEKVKQMQLHVFGDNRMAFDAKRQIFFEIASVHDKSWYKSYKPSVKENLNNELSYIITERNKLAHLIIDTDENLPVDEIVFLRFLNDIKEFKYDKLKTRDMVTLINKVCNFIGQRLGTMSPSSSASGTSSEPS